MRHPKISVIIPCYNLGAYLNETVDSVLAQTCQDFEIIIVDDGSDDPGTRTLLGEYRRPKTRVIRTRNQGPSKARNTGIAAALGKYILPLDADDRIEKTYLAKAAKILDTQPKTGIVYCRAKFFGTRQEEWALPPYSLETMLVDNLIFVTALFRKTSWGKVGGFNPNMVHGMEDYDFWISILDRENCGVHRINEVLFFYRITDHSRTVRLGANDQNEIDMFTRIFYNHQKFFLKDNRMRFLIANRRDLLREVNRLHGIIRESPALRLEAALDKYPRFRAVYFSFARRIVAALIWIKNKTGRRRAC